jgi:hypothetical protein
MTRPCAFPECRGRMTVFAVEGDKRTWHCWATDLLHRWVEYVGKASR